MKAKIIKLSLAVAVMTVVGYYSYEKNEVAPFATMTLNEVEAVASCEVSSDPNLNRGYCVKNYGGAGDACVSSGSGSEVRCSGNI